VSSDEHFWSAETFRIFELDPSSTVSLKVMLERIHPLDMPSVELTIEAATRAEGIDLEFRLLMPDGRTKYLHVVGQSEKGDTGNVEVIGAVMDVTARRLTELELRRSRAHLADAQRLSRTGCVGLDGRTNRIFWSEEAARIYGYPPQTEPTADLILQRSHPDDVGLVRDALEGAAHGQNDFDYEHRLLMPDGSIKHLHDLAHRIRDESGHEEIVGAIMDVTERKLAEGALRSSEAYLAEAQTLSKTGSFAWSPTADVTYFSDECYRVLGFEPQGDHPPPFDTIMQRIHPDDQARCRSTVENSIRDKVNLELDYRILHPDKRLRDIHCVGRVVLDRFDELVEIVGSVIDITESKVAEEAIRRREAELRQVVDFTPQIVCVYGPRCERVYANRWALTYFGMTHDDWLKLPDGYEVHPGDIPRLTAPMDDALTNGTAFELETRLRSTDGSYRWFLARGNPVRNDRGVVTGWYVASTDIEERKKAEDRLRQENVALREEVDKASMFDEIVGSSPALTAVLSRVAKVAGSDSTVLITGETGTGKELVARAIHRRSRRSSRAFVAVNCAAIPRELIAAELFGHEKGAFTGALQRRPGRFELADGGSLFLDEVGELSPEMQVALLRVLQEREFERLGGNQRVRVDVRVIAATNRNLSVAIEEGRFREDLFYRLNVFPIDVPPLRQRTEDIPLLVRYLLDRYAQKAGKSIRQVNSKTLRRLQSYAWPGNVRELQNVIERSVIVCESDEFTVDESWLSSRAATDGHLKLSSALVAQEKTMIEDALRVTGGRVYGPSGAAARLGIPRSTLESRIRALKIHKARFRA
jgi:formate hydrogenlyase transcriptional activator